MPLDTPRGPAIAVVGASALFPASPDGASFWRNILAGSDLISDVPPDHWLIEDYYDPDPSAPGKTYARRGGFLPGVAFDPIRHGLPPKQLSTTDTAQLLGLIVAQRVLDDAASVQFGKVDRRDISVILGVASATELVGQMAARIQRPHWIKALRDAGLPESRVEEICDRIEATYPEWDESTFPGLLGNVVAGRIANRLDLGGTNCVVDAACASSLGAVAMAVQELQLGHSDLVITGGVDALNDIFMYMCFSKTPALSPTGDCRPFSDAADGTMLGEGIGMLALRRLEDAERDGDRVYAVLRGVGSSSDGRAKSIYAPRAQGQEAAIRRAYEHAGYGPGEVGLVEAHGTATKAGDAAEFEGLMGAFGDPGREDRQWCALGSVKSQIGHTKAAAGAASLFKAVMALHHRVLPPTIKVDRPNPKLGIENSPFYLNTRARPWIEVPGRTRKASVSSFGFGGSNFHVTLEEYAGSAPAPLRTSALPAHLVLLAAGDAAGLLARVAETREALGSESLAALARRTQLDFDPRAAHRLAVLATDADGARSLLATSARSVEEDGARAFSMPNRVHYSARPEVPRMAFLFPGQGSQAVEMGAELAMEFDVARRVWDESARLVLGDGERLDRFVFPVPVFDDEQRAAQAAALTRTDRAQPAIGAASLSMLRLLEALGVRPDACAGHSYGEIPALHAAGAIGSLGEVLEVSRERGALMHAAAASTPAAMTAVRAAASDLEALLERSGIGGITLANVNSPRQVVVAGETGAIETLEARLTEEGLGFRRLPVATAFHTGLVAPSAEPFAAYLAGVPLRPPAVPVYSNTTAEPYPQAPEEIRSTLAHQLARPVRFMDMVERMYADGVRLFVEVGPGAVLTGMVGDCLAGRPHVAVAMDTRGRDGRLGLLDTLAVLSANGVAVDFAAFWAGFAPPAADEEGNLSPATVRLNGGNYGKPYPPTGGAAGRPARNPEVREEQPEAVGSERAPTAARGGSQPASAPVAAPASTGGPAPAAAPAPDPGWSSAFAAMQQQMLQAQLEFTRVLAESHQAFLRTSERAFQELGAIKGGGEPVEWHGSLAAPAAPTVPAAPAAAPFAPAAPAPARAVPAPAPVEPRPATLDHAALLLEVVAEKTGYPVEMLTLELELEAGLGIDSIKRVEILSVLQERIPELSRVDTAELAALNTLGEIVAFAQRATGGPAPSAGAAVPAAAALDHAALLLEVVAEKTGYPVEMLTLELELEAGLGIDSIKRVEILSVLQERIPELSRVDTAELAALNTLGEIVAFAQRATGGAEATPGAASEAEGIEDSAGPAALRRVVVRFEEVSAPGLVTPGLFGADPLYLVGGAPDLAAALAERLERAGVPVRRVEAPPAEARAVILLTGLAPDREDPGTVAALNEEVFLHLRACAATLASDGGLLVTVQDTGGDFGIRGGAGERAWSAGIAAAAKTAALEWPRASVRALDVERGDRSSEEVAAALAAELLTGGAEREVGLRSDGRRGSPRLVGADGAAAVEAPLDPEGVLVVSGGGRGVTAACLSALLQRSPARLAILGRTPLREEPDGLRAAETDAALKAALLERHRAAGRPVSPQELGAEVRGILAQRELRANLDALAAHGRDVRYHAVDVTDAAEVARTLAEVRAAQGPIRGLVHAAGVLADREIQRKTVEQFRLVFRTKVDGFRNLLDATRDDALSHVVCFSSVAAARGNPGQVDYAMANEVLNRVCRREASLRGDDCLVKSIGWGPWAGGMVDAGLERHFASLGVALIPLEEGARFFAAEVTGENGAAPELLFGGGLEAFGRSTAAAPEGWSHEVRFHRDTHASLADHAIRDLPVVPVVAALDLVLQAVRAGLPEVPIRAATELKVLKGIVLPEFDGAGDRVRVECSRAGEESVSARIVGIDGTVHYSLRVLVGEGGPPPARPPLPRDLSAWQPVSGAIYDGRLFHGPAFRTIRALVGISDGGCAGELGSVGGSPAGFHLDPAVLDGGLQLAVLWVHEHLGRESLPTGLDAYRLHRRPRRDEVVRCEAVCLARSELMTRWDLAYLGSDGELLCSLEGVQVHVLPGTRHATAGGAPAALAGRA